MQIAGLLDGQRNWVTNLANASSVLYNSTVSYTHLTLPTTPYV